MKKVLRLVLIPCLILSMVYLHANNYGAEKVEGVPIKITEQTGCNGQDRSNYISAHINGHYLNVAFLADLGSVTIKILDESYTMLELSYIETPSGYQYYIPLEGRYTLLIALEDGDEYRGDFEVSE